MKDVAKSRAPITAFIRAPHIPEVKHCSALLAMTAMSSRLPILNESYVPSIQGDGGRLTRTHQSPGDTPARIAWMRSAKAGKSVSCVADRIPLWTTPVRCKPSKWRRLYVSTARPRLWRGPGYRHRMPHSARLLGPSIRRDRAAGDVQPREKRNPRRRRVASFVTPQSRLRLPG
jgi:hypothetical protein